MSKDTHSSTQTQKPSALEKLSLGFEYDMTWSDAKRLLRGRTL